MSKPIRPITPDTAARATRKSGRAVGATGAVTDGVAQTGWRYGLCRWLARGLMLLLIGFMLIQLWVFGCLWYWRDHPVQYSMFMQLHRLTDATPIRHDWVSYARISPQLKQALVAGEDGRFMQHQGFDWDGIERAWRRNERRGEIVQGGSTISQQLAKNLFLYNQRSYLRKGQEAIITWMMERMWSKRRILEVYLNVIEFGDGIYGAEAAAQHYYGRSARRLTAAQAARLAAMVPAPRYYQQHPDSSRLRKRTRQIQVQIGQVRVPA